MHKFRKPEFMHLDYVDYVVEEKPYFLVTWKTKHAYQVTISDLDFRSFKKHSSAYRAIPVDITSFEVKISNSWRSHKVLITLRKTNISGQIEFEIDLHPKLTKGAQVSLPVLNLRSRKIHIKASTPNITIAKPKIINLNYP